MSTQNTGPTVMVAGHICLDITPVLDTPPVAALQEVLAPGKLVHVGPADIHTGGCVANTGLAMQFLGGQVRLAAKIGRDPFGQLIRTSLSAHGCEGGLIESAGDATSYTVVVAVPGVDRCFLHDPGANDTFTAADITDDMLAEAQHLHFGYPPLMRRMYEDGGKELSSLFSRAKSLGLTTSLDMAAVDPHSPAGRANWPAILAATLPHVDFFVPSAEEVCFMLDRPRYEEWGRRAGGKDVTRVLSPQEDIAPLARKLLGLGAKVVLIKCGAPGLYYASADAETLPPLCAARGLKAEEWAGLAGFEESYYQPRVVSGTGAGDTSIAAFLTAMRRGKSLHRCVQLAAATGACCISAVDALSGLEPLDVLEMRIDAGWEKERF